jgi:hypothetical protein
VTVPRPRHVVWPHKYALKCADSPHTYRANRVTTLLALQGTLEERRR